MNNSTIAVPDLPILCPLGDRRTTKELYVKFFVINLTALIFFFHFIKHRDGLHFCGAFYLYLAPLNLVFRYVLALSGILFVSLVQTCRASLITKKWSFELEGVISPLLHLLGRARGHDYSDLPTVDPETPAAQTETDKERLSAFVGKLIVNGAFIAQCSASIFLYHRRQRHNAVMNLDRRMYGTACAGLLLGLLNLGRSLKLPIFNDFVPVNEGGRTKMDKFALLCRGVACKKELDVYEEPAGEGEGEDHPHYAIFWENAFMEMILLIVTVDDSLVAVQKGIWHNMTTGIPWIIFTSLFVLVGGAGFCIAILTSEKEKDEEYNTFVVCVFLFPCCVALFIAAMYLFLLTMVAMSNWTSLFIMDFSGVTEFTTTNQTTPCPKLWADPMSEWVWWLA